MLATSCRVPRAGLVLVLITATLCSCAGAPPFDAGAVVREWAKYMQSRYVLRPGDELQISVYQETDLEQTVTVSPSGTVALERIPNELHASGKNMSAFRAEVELAYGKVLIKPEISMTLSGATGNSVYIAGEVKSPGPIPYASGMLLSQAISSAGGLEITAKGSDVRILRNANPKPRTFRVNYDEILFSASPDFILLPGDVVFCQTSGIADAGNWVELYIRRMLPIPITGVSVGGN